MIRWTLVLALAAPFAPGQQPWWTAVQDVSHSQAHHLLDGDCTIITTTSAMPKMVKEAFAGEINSTRFQMADPGERYQETDVVVRPGLPSRRLVFAGSCGRRWFIHYERGGIGHSYSVVIFEPDADGTLETAWGGTGSVRATRLDELRSAIAEGKFPGHTL